MSAAHPTKTGRILWLGNHVLLLKTELPRLRALGFEIFHAPCRRVDREHQSASTDWEPGATTLPADVHARLVDTDLYFKPIAPEVFDLLNRHFDTVIVTIQARWVAELLRGFTGRIVYRAYGDSTSVTEQLWRLGAFRALMRRDNFWFVPFAAEYSRQEQFWVRRRELVVPYCVDDLIAGAKDSWAPGGSAPEVMLNCPNIVGNPFFGHHFKELKQCFNHPGFRIYGLQPEAVSDPQVVGTLPFADVVNRYRSAAAVLYTYRWPTVCLLPPIEMMIVGGPVVYLSGSLLDIFMGPGAPGRARDMLEAREMCERLLAGDAALARAITRSQATVRERYLPDHVWPRFDAGMRTILSGVTSDTNPRASAVTWSAGAVEPRGRVVVLAHDASLTPVLEGGRYVSTEATVVRLIHWLRALFTENAGRPVVLVCQNDGVAGWYGLLAQFFPADAFTFLCLGPEQPEQPVSPSLPKVEEHAFIRRVTNAAERAIPPGRLRRRLRGLYAQVIPPVEPALLQHNQVISLHPECEQGLDRVPMTRLYAETSSDAALARSIEMRLVG